jgi:hypothetical protein
LQGYKIYGTMIKMFIPESLNSLPQPPRWSMASRPKK